MRVLLPEDNILLRFLYYYTFRCCFISFSSPESRVYEMNWDVVKRALSVQKGYMGNLLLVGTGLCRSASPNFPDL